MDRVRQNLFAEYGLTKDTLKTAPEEIRSELYSKLHYEHFHSPEAKNEFCLLNASIAQEKRLLVKSRAEEILAVHHARALRFSTPKKLVAAVRQRSTDLYYTELRDHFRSKYIEEIEKSDLLIPELKAVARKAEEPDMPNLYEVANEMTAELLHPDAFQQILAQRLATKQHRRERRRERIRKFFSFDYWLRALPLFVRKLIAPVEVKRVLSAFSEEQRHLTDAAFSPSLGIDVITQRVIEDILRWSDEIRKDVYSGKTPRAVALWLMANVTRDYLASGAFHVYRGYLSMQGVGTQER